MLPVGKRKTGRYLREMDRVWITTAQMRMCVCPLMARQIAHIHTPIEEKNRGVQSPV